MKNSIFFISFFLLTIGCGQYDGKLDLQTQNRFEIIDAASMSSVVFKDNYIVCYLTKETHLTCNNKHEFFPIFIFVQDELKDEILKINPGQQSSIIVDGLAVLKRKKIDLWDECKVDIPPSYCDV